jgi:hypothetical protein
MINAGIEAMAHFTMNRTMDPNGMFTSTMRTEFWLESSTILPTPSREMSVVEKPRRSA